MLGTVRFFRKPVLAIPSLLKGVFLSLSGISRIEKKYRNDFIL
jgi:hypothetical protein